MNKKKHTGYLTLISGITLVALVLLVLFIGTEYYQLSSIQKEICREQEESSYEYHCAFITDNYDDTFWDSVYTGAQEQGKSSGIYVENFGRDLYVTHTTDELLEMAMAANVDAIVVEATGKSSTRTLINQAVSQGIAVSTIYKDDMDSRRFSFTGVNNVLLGYQYGSLALKHSSGDIGSIMVLLDGESTSPEQRLLVSNIGLALEDQGSDAKVDTMVLDSRNAFEVEEQVRDFMRKNQETVDVIICTDLVQTQFVSQTAIDLNCVGEFTIIGSYQNHSVLEALKSSVIAANVVIDTEEMGRTAIVSLEEYLNLGHASDYSSISIRTIGKQDAIQRLAAMEEGGYGSED